MKKRVVILIASGAFLLGVAALVLSAIVRHAQPEFTSIYSSDWRGYPEEKGPKVLLGYDGPYWRVADAIRIDVRRGVPHTRVDEAPIEDVARYVTAQLQKKDDAWVVVTASRDEKLGDIVRVLDACRTTRVHGIVLNQFPLGTLE
jgi:hypothetical protein